MPLTRFIAVICCSFIAACSPNTEVFQESIPKGQLGKNVLPSHYQLHLEIDPEEDGFAGRVDIAIDIERPTRTIWMHGGNLEVKDVFFTTNEKRIQGTYARHDDQGVSSVEFSEPVIGSGQLHFTYSGVFASTSEALFKVEQNGESYIYSQMQAISARQVFPSFDDPQFKTPFTISVSSPANNAVIVNTPVLSSEKQENGRVLHKFAVTKPLPTYLLAFAVGPFDVVEWEPVPVSDIRKHEIPLRGVTVAGMGDKMRYSLQHTARFVEILEEYFNIPFPYEKIDLIAAAGHLGAMENPGAIIYSESLLFVDENSSLEALRWFARVHAHELAHMWFGNLVTPHWWEDIWLNEAFASWMEVKAAHAWNPDLKLDRVIQKDAFYVMKQDSTAAAREVKQPVLENRDIGKTFDGITYTKGAAVLEMVESLVGESGFRKGVQFHLNKYAHGTASSQEFFESMSEGAKIPELVDTLNSMVDRAGVPYVDVSIDCEGMSSTVSLDQSRYKPLGAAYSEERVWTLPFCYRTNMGSACELVDEALSTFELAGCPQYFVPNMDGDGYYRWHLDQASLEKLFDNLHLLSPSELLSISDSVTAGYYAGDVDSFQLLNLYQKLAEHTDTDVAMAPSAELPVLRRSLLQNEVTTHYAEFVTKLYDEKMSSLGIAFAPEDNIDVRESRAKLMKTMAFEAKDAGVRQTLSSLANQKYLTGEGSENTDILLPPDWEAMALVIAIEDSGIEEAQHLEKIALNSDVEEFRQKALYAVAQSQSAEFLEYLQSETLPDEGILSANRLALLFGLRNNYSFQKANWEWAKDNMDITLSLFPELFKDRVAYLGSRFCDRESQQDLNVYFAQHEESNPGAGRKAAEVAQYIEQCVVFSQAKSAEFKSALAQTVDRNSNL